MSSIDLTVTSRIVHLRHREKTFAEVQLDRAPELIAGDDLGFLLPKATQRWNEQLHNRFRAAGWSRAVELRLDSRAAVRGGRLADGRARAPGPFEQENDDDDGAAARARRARAPQARPRGRARLPRRPHRRGVQVRTRSRAHARGTRRPGATTSWRTAAANDETHLHN